MRSCASGVVELAGWSFASFFGGAKSMRVSWLELSVPGTLDGGAWFAPGEAEGDWGAPFGDCCVSADVPTIRSGNSAAKNALRITDFIASQMASASASRKKNRPPQLRSGL